MINLKDKFRHKRRLINLKVKFVILQNKQGRTRLSKWYIIINEEEKIKIQNEEYQLLF